MLRPFAHPVARCWMLLSVVAQSLNPFAHHCQHGRNNPFARSLKMTDTVIAFLLLLLLVLWRACNIDLVQGDMEVFNMQIQATRPDEKDLVPISATTKEN